MGGKMKSYYKNEINRVLKADPKPYGNVYRMKIKGDSSETRWMNITPTELKNIKKTLNRY